MVMMTLESSPPRPVQDRDELPVEDLVALLVERESLLRSKLLDARDALVRGRIPSSAAPGSPSREAGPQAAGSRRPPSSERADGYQDLRRRVRAAVAAAVPAGSRILVVSRGDSDLLSLRGGRRAEHFPGDGAGGYAGHHPADSAAAIAELEELRRLGAGFLVFPATSIWWLEHYRELARHLERRYPRVVDAPDTCVVFDVRVEPGEAAPALAAAGAVPSAPAATRAGEAVEAPAREPVAAPARAPLAAVTIISRNYLSQARVLAQSFLRQEPRSRFYVLVVDRLPEGVDFGADVTLVDPEELGIPSLFEMCFKYGIVEFNTAVKPYLLSLLFEKYGEEVVAYFDPDILVMRPLDELRDALATSDIVLTPHIMRPLPLDGKRPSEQDIMISGAYNLGFIALRRSPQAEEFLAWWEERLQDGCRIDVKNGLFTDQKWVDLAPCLFPSTVILRDPTYNVAFWNLHERSITRDGDEFLVNGRPAAFFHISGFDPRQPGKVSKHQTRAEVAPESALAALFEHYAALLMANGYEETSGWEYGYERFENGIRVHPLLRQIYLNLPPEERRRFGDPFSATGPDSFLDWATRPRPDEGGLSLFLQTLYKVRYDLPLTFPDVRGRDRAAFVNWARRWGSAEMKFEPELVRDDPATAAAAPKRPGPRPAGGPARPPAAVANGNGAGDYEAVVERVRNIAKATLPAGSRVLVVSKGDYRLLDLGGSEGWHFPQTDDGVYGGYHPPDSDIAVAHLEALREKGAHYLLIPQPAFWWLEYYDGFRRHLEQSYRLVVQSPDACLLYSLRDVPRDRDRRRPRAERGWRWWRRGGPAAAQAGAGGGR